MKEERKHILNIRLPYFFKQFIWLLTFGLFYGFAFGAHQKGADIEYKCLGGNTYEITFKFYQDCTNGAPAPSAAGFASSFSYSNNCGAPAPAESWTLVSVTEVTPTCPTALTSCDVGVGYDVEGVALYLYRDTVTLASNCIWDLRFSLCCRDLNNNVSGTVQGPNFFVDAQIRTNIAACNSSPVLTAEPAPYVCNSAPLTLSVGAIDPDGDSLTYQLVEGKSSPTQIVTYINNFTFDNPLDSITPFAPNLNINPNNGDINIFPTTNGKWLVVVRINEYDRNTKLLKGFVKRDFSILVDGCAANATPFVVGNSIDTVSSYGTLVGNDTIATYAGNDTLCFDIRFADLNFTDSLSVSSNILSALGPTATLTQTGTNPKTATICWPITGVSVGAYNVNIVVKDDNCPVNAQKSFPVTIIVNGDAQPTGFNQIPETCPGTQDGGFQALFSGGLGPFSFLWYQSTSGVPGTFNLMPNDTNQILSNAVPGRFYQFRVVDKGTGNTSLSSNFIMTYVATAGIIIQNDTILRPNCRDVCGTEIEISQIVGGSVAPDTVTSYSFEWRDALNNIVDNTNHPKNLCPGTYTVFLTDDNGCDTNYTYTLNTPATFEAVFSDTTNVLCRGESTGEFVLQGNEATCGIIENICGLAELNADSILGGTTPFAFNEFPSAFPGGGEKVRQQFLYRASDLRAIGLTPGKISAIDFFVSGFSSTINKYKISMTCTSQDTLNTWENTTTVVFDEKQVTSNSGASWNRFNFDRSFQWDGISNIVVEICTEINITNINQNTQMSTTPYFSSLVYATDTSEACGATTISGSTVNLVNNFVNSRFKRPDIIFRYCDVQYTYSWLHNGALTDTVASNLSAGIYTGIVTNSDGCRDSVTATITQPDSTFKFIFIDSVPLVCFGDTNGIMVIEPRNGSGPYVYNWNPDVISSPDSIATNLIANINYNVTVTDGNNCSANNSISIGERDQIDPVHNVIQNIVCAGDTLGRVQINNTNGTGPFHYHWSPSVIFAGADSSIGTNVKGGIVYRVTVTDANGCIDSTSFSLPAPSGINPTVVLQQNQPCFGDTVGVIGILPTSGLAPYNYVWPSGVIHVDNGDSTRATNLRAGINYKVYVTDANTCNDSITVSVTQPSLLTASVLDSTDALCFGASNGSARVVPQGGTRPYSYAWQHNGTETDSITSNLPFGRWVVTVTDNNNCQATDSVNIGQPAASMTADIINIEQISCFGFNDASFEAQAIGGTRPYGYSWNGSAFNANDSIRTNQGPGQYILRVQDDQGCSYADTINLSQPAQLNASITQVISPTCFGFNDGIITVTPSGGRKPYSYLWNDVAAQTDSSAVGLSGSPSGVLYKVILRDSANQCVDSVSQLLTSPNQLSINKADSNNVNCFGNLTGSARVTVSNGTAPYRYLWKSLLVTDSLISNVGAGIYEVLVTDTNNCKDSISFNITEPDTSIFGSFSNADSISCNGLTNGSATFSARGGTSPYVFTWSAGTGVGFPNDSTTNNLGAGYVFVTVTDANNCLNITDSVFIAEPQPLSAIIVNTSNAGCNGSSNGSATVRASGGTGNYIYRWSAGTGGVNDTTSTGLSAGLISVTIKSAIDTNCTFTVTDTILENLPIQISVDSTSNISCNGLNDGFISVSASGGYNQFVYAWSHNGALTDSFATNLGAGNYIINVTDTAGCPSADTTLNLTQPFALSITKDDSTNVSCFGNNDGKAKVTVVGGTQNYTYNWNTIPVQTADSAVNLIAGNYKVVVSDANGCSDSVSFNIEQPAQGVFTSTQVLANVSCFGFADGEAKVSPSGGTTPYNYTWSHNATLNDSVATGLLAGTYFVTVEDNNGCSAGTDTIIITEPAVFSATLLIDSNVTCHGFSNGKMSVINISGGTAPYTYLWSGGTAPLTDSVVTGLAAGGYAVTITDSNNCSIVLTDTIVQPTPLTGSAIPPVLPGFSYLDDYKNQHIYFSDFALTWDQARQAALNVGGDLLIIKDSVDNAFYSSKFPVNSWIGLFQDLSSPLYSEPGGGWYWVDSTLATYFNWSVGEPNNLGPEHHAHFWDVSGGWNDIRGTDIYRFGIWINKGGKFSQDVTCNGLNDGFASYDAGGGVTPYTYLWSNNDNDSLAENLVAGTYFVTITDANGCELIDSAIINQPSPLIATIADSTDETCIGANNGNTRVIWQGGNGGVSFEWSNADTDSIAETLSAGSYGVKVQDFKGCSDSVFVTISAADSIQLQLTKLADNLCFGNTNGEVKGIASGGAGNLTYSWSGGVVINDTLVTNLSAGLIKVTVTDSNLCSISDSLEILEPNEIIINHTIDSVPTCLSANGQITVQISGGTKFSGLPYQYTWLDQNLDTLNPQPSDSIAVNLSAQTYSIVIADSNGCSASKIIPLNSIDGPVITADSVVDALCYNGNTGAIFISVAGAGPFTYLWLPDSQIVEDIAGLDSGQYIVQVTDTNNCPSFQSINVGHGSPFNISMLATQVFCAGDSNGFAVATPIGSIGPHTFIWNKGNPFTPAFPPIPIDSARQDLPPGFVTVTVTNNLGCTQSDSVFVPEPLPLQDSLIQTLDISCFGDNTAQIKASTSGGTAPYFYQWSNSPLPVLVKHDSIKTNLAAGIYFVTVTDTAGCTLVDSIVISQPDSLIASISGFANMTCNAFNDAFLSVSVKGGIPPYIYSWSAGNGGVNDSVTQNVDTTFVSVSITDQSGCGPIVISQNINEPDPISFTFNKTDVNCFGNANGIVEANVSGGNGGFIYNWSAGTAGANNNITMLLDTGKVVLSVTDSLGCPAAIDSIFITQPDTFVATINQVSNVSCFGLSDGLANVIFTGGNGGVNYAWNDALSQSDSTAINLPADTFEVVLTDARGCISVADVIISQPDSIDIQFSNIQDPSCFGFGDGEVTANVNGGLKPYQYNWNFGSAGNTDSVNTNLFDGLISLTIVDSNGCSKFAEIQLNEPAEFTTQFTIDSLPLCANNNGGITAQVSGGTPFSGYPYIIHWLDDNKAPLVPPITDTIAQNLAQGLYYLAVQDSSGCFDTSSVGLNALDGPVIIADSIIDASCFGFADGAIFITDSAGTGPKTYSWNSGLFTSKDINNLPVGNYQLTITDSLGCSAFFSGTIQHPDAINIQFFTTPETCVGSDGTVQALVQGGTRPYNFLWNKGTAGLADSSRIALDSGIVLLQITDSNNCIYSDSTLIQKIPQLNAQLNVLNNVFCFGDSSGLAAAIVSGGLPPYTYNWSAGNGGINDSTSGNLTAGIVSVIINDTQGCAPIVLSQNITQPNSLNFSVNAIASTCAQPDGILVAQPSGGTSPYNYQWLNNAKLPIGQTSDSAINLLAGTYFLAISDSNACLDTVQANLNDLGGASILLNFIINTSAVGNCDGGIDVTITPSGAGIASVLWTPGGDVTEDISNKCAGPYTLTVTDSAGCTSIFTDTILDPPPGPPIVLSSGFNATSCDTSICSGRVFTSIVSGGIAPFSFNWSSNINDTLFEVNGLCAGTYFVTVTDSVGKTSTDTVVIPQRDFIQNIAASITDVSCNGDSNGSITLAVNGGLSPYTYQWSHNVGLNSDSAFSLSADTFIVTVTESGGCSLIDTMVVNQPSVVSANIFATNPVCGASNGVLTAFPSGGTAPYFGNWLDGNKNSLGIPPTTFVINTLSPGVYYLVLTDTLGCGGDTIPATISNSNGPTIALVSKTNTSFPGLCDGALDVSITPFGTTPIDSILWMPTNDTTEDITGLCAGVYSLEVTDTNGCKAFYVDTISDPAAPLNITINFSIDTANCNPTICDGKLTANVQGGYTPYTLLWSNNAITDSITNLCSGTYFITVTDSIGTVVTDSVFLPTFNAITSLAFSVVNPSCNASADGEISVTPNGGSSPYTYSWSHNSGLNSNNAVGLISGNYTITVSDANGCPFIDSIVLTSPPSINVIFDTVSASCALNDGEIRVQISGGNPLASVGYNLNWLDASFNSFVPTQTNDTLSNIGAGTYYLAVSDSTCSDTFQVILNNKGAATITLDSIFNPQCFGFSDGEINVTITGGTFPFLYNWNNGLSSLQDLQNVGGGIYSLVVTDSNNCISTFTDTLNEPNQIQNSISVLQSISCNSVCDGILSSIAINTQGPEVYTWSNGQTGSVVSGVCAGNIFVTITDAQGCSITDSISLAQPSALQIDSIVEVNPTCMMSNGSLTAFVSGGVQPYNFTWQGNQGNALLNFIGAGIFSLQVTDSNNCSANTTVGLSNIGGATFSKNSTPVTCAGNCDGEVSIANISGSGPFTIAWQGSASTNDTLTGLCAGVYGVQVTDSANCITADTIVVNQPNALSGVAQIVQLPSCGVSNGKVKVIGLSGGLPFSNGYNLVWLDAAFTPLAPLNNTDSLINAAAGTYYLRIQDSLLCQHDIMVQLPNIGAPSIVLNSLTNATCAGSSSGSIDVNVSGGTAPYQFIWQPTSDTTEDISGLIAGNYSLQVTDANNCINFGNYTITNSGNISVTPVVISNLSCFNSQDGRATLSVSGATQPLFYQWQNGESTDTAVALNAGTTNVTVTDAFGCSASSSVSINAPLSISIDSLVITQPNCNQCNGVIFAAASGGFGNLNYAWSNSQVGQGAGSLCAGVYTLTITDQNGCNLITQIPISDIGAPVINVSTNDALCFGSCNGNAKINVLSGTSPISYNWPTLFNLSDTAFGLCAGVYPIEVTDSAGCTVADTVNIGEPQKVNVTFSKILPTCGNSDGSITANINGGTPFNNTPYTLLWLDANNNVISPINTTANINNLAAGVYNLAVADSNSCGGIFPVTLPNNVAPTITLDSLKNATCSGVCDGEIFVSAAGASPFSFLWNPSNKNTASATGLCKGNYFVQVTDVNNCIGIANYTISEDIVISTVVNILQPITCSSVCDASARVNVIGGSGTLQYQWDNGELTQTAVALCAGKHRVTVTDAFGCSVVDSVNIQNANPVQISSTSIVQPGCNQCNGSIGIVASGGQGVLNYVWSNGGNTPIINGLCAGTYTISVFDNNGCVSTTNIPLNNFVGPQINLSKTNISCNGQSDGLATVSVNSVHQPIKVYWPQVNQNTLQVSGLSAGNYYVEVTDSLGCLRTDTISIIEPNPIVATFSLLEPSCGTALGQITAQVNGGTVGSSGYLYFWLDQNQDPLIPFQNGSTANNLSGGLYHFRVTDSLGCQSVIPVGLGNDNGPSIILENIIHTTCKGLCDGEILTRITGDDVKILWQNTADTVDDISGLCAGKYTVQATDSNGCVAFATYEVFGKQTVKTILTSKQNASCLNANDGQIEVENFGGTAPLNYLWTGPIGFNAALKNITNLFPGNYNLAVADGNGCVDSLSVDVFANTELFVSANDTLICQGIGSINLQAEVIPSAGPVIQWIDDFGNIVGIGNNPTLIPRNEKVTYFVTASFNGCITIDTMVLNITPYGPVFAGNDTTIILGETLQLGGNPTAPAGSNFAWEPFTEVSNEAASNPTATPNQNQTYIVTAVGQNGCTGTDTVTVTVELPFEVNDGFSPNGDGVNDVWNIAILKDYPNAEVEVYTRWGKLIYKSPVPYLAWDGKFQGNDVPVGTYYYAIKLNDGQNSEPITGTITIIK